MKVLIRKMNIRFVNKWFHVPQFIKQSELKLVVPTALVGRGNYMIRWDFYTAYNSWSIFFYHRTL